jgi:hypothetical protein
MRGFWMIGMLLLLVVPTTRANEFQHALSDVAYIDNGQGQSRVLFRWGDLSELGAFVIKRARLEIPVTGSAAERTIDLHLHNVTTEWNAGSVDWSTGWTRAGGDFDESVYSSAMLDCSLGSHTLTVDVSQLLKEVYESGSTSEGVLLTVSSENPEVVGIDSEDLSRFASLASGTLVVDYVKVPRPPAGVQ